MEARESRKTPRFWPWFFTGGGAEPGWRRLCNTWLILHGAVGTALALIVPMTITQASSAVLLPLAGVLIGLSFAWAGNAIALIQSPEIRQLAVRVRGGVETYVFTFQLAILSIIVTMCLWGLAGLGVFDRECLLSCPKWLYSAVAATLYTLASVTIRECWHVVLGVQMLLLAQMRIQDNDAEGR